MPDHPEKPRDRGLDLAEHATYSTVTQASATVLESLREVVGFRFWAVTRVTGQTYAIVGTGLGEVGLGAIRKRIDERT